MRSFYHTMTKKLLVSVLATLLTVGAWLAPALAQTALNATTLSVAVSDTSGQFITVASATGFIAPVSGAIQTYAVIDREFMSVLAVTGTTIRVGRGVLSSRSTPHVSGAPVTVMAPAAVGSYIPSGQCTRTNLLYVPFVVGAGPGLGAETGTLYDCLGTAPNGQWVQTNAQGSLLVKGATVASAGTIAPSGNYFVVSGTTTISTITVPAGWGASNCLALEPSGLWATNTAGNINIASTAVVGKLLFECWNGAKWTPSY